MLATFGPEAAVADLWQGSTNKMITLMISATSMPTLLHFGLVVVNVAYTALGSVIKLFALLFTGNARFFATAMSAVLLLIYGLIYFMLITLDK